MTFLKTSELPLRGDQAESPPQEGPTWDLAAIDRELASQGLLNERPIEQLGGLEDIAFEREGEAVPYLLPNTLEPMVTLQEWAILWLCMAFGPRMDTPSSLVRSCLDFCGARPKDWKHSLLQDLFRRGHFVEWAPRYQAVAYLVIVGMNRENDIARLYPVYSMKFFHKAQAKIHREVEEKLPEAFKRFQKYWKALTPLQQEAVKKVYFENDERRPRRKVAEDLGIAFESLRDRIRGAERKLGEHFPELIPSRRNRPAYWRALFRVPDTRDMGMFRKSGDRIYPVYRIDPETRERREIHLSPSKKRTPRPGNEDARLWLKATQYWPRHKGTYSPLLAHLPNAHAFEASRHLDLRNNYPDEEDNPKRDRRVRRIKQIIPSDFKYHHDDVQAEAERRRKKRKEPTDKKRYFREYIDERTDIDESMLNFED